MTIGSSGHRTIGPSVHRAIGSSGEDGTTLIETLIALTVLALGISGLLDMVTLTAKLTEDQGHLAARATEYAQDKMEQLLALKFGDTSSNTALFPAGAAGGTDRKSTRLNSSHVSESRMPSSA